MIPGLVSDDQVSSIFGAFFVSSLFCEMLMADAFPDERPCATAVASSDSFYLQIGQRVNKCCKQAPTQHVSQVLEP